MRVSASIVIYNEDEATLSKAINSFLTLDIDKELIIVDNSPSTLLKEFCENFDNVEYIYSNVNIGFGAGHNLAFQNMKKASDIHIIINPDVYFDNEIKDYFIWMSKVDNISISVPRVYFPNNVYQHTIRKLPTLLTLIKRKLNIKSDEFDENDFKDISEIPFAHGCFLVFKTDIFNKLSGFDENFFMYMEDVDIFIRAKKLGKTVLNPDYKIYHEFRKGSSVNKKLLLFHIKSALRFFFKYPKLIF